VLICFVRWTPPPPLKFKEINSLHVLIPVGKRSVSIHQGVTIQVTPFLFFHSNISLVLSTNVPDFTRA